MSLAADDIADAVQDGVAHDVPVPSPDELDGVRDVMEMASVTLALTPIELAEQALPTATTSPASP